MPSFKTLLVFVILIILAFGFGYGLGYMKLRSAEKEWAAARDEMQSKISALAKELAQVKARETLREMPEKISQVITHLSEKNFGLALKTVDELKGTFEKIQPFLDEEWKVKFPFLLPGLEEIKKEAENVGPNAKKKAEEVKSLLEQALRSSKKG
jgi:hypothetical protein